MRLRSGWQLTPRVFRGTHNTVGEAWECAALRLRTGAASALLTEWQYVQVTFNRDVSVEDFDLYYAMIAQMTWCRMCECRVVHRLRTGYDAGVMVMDPMY